MSSTSTACPICGRTDYPHACFSAGTAPPSRPDSRTAREHAETVRRYLGKQYPETRPAVAALDALLADVERLEGERDEARQDALGQRTNAEAWKDSCKAAEALAERRAVALRTVRDWIRDGKGSESEAAEALDAALEDGGQEQE